MELSNPDEFKAALIPLAGRKVQSSSTAVYGIRKPPALAKTIFLIGVPYDLRSALIYKDNVLLERSTWAQ